MFDIEYKNQTLLQETTAIPSKRVSTILIMDSWKHYLRILNILIALSFICNCVLLFYVIFNIIRRLCFFCKSKKDSSKTSSTKRGRILNYVTIAFISHQAFIDIFRILYFLFYLNNLKFQQHLKDTGNESELMNYLNNSLFSKYCFHVASFYSILTMVTLINILAIFISETCRFYDLKLDSHDTSNFCCVLFGIMLIWLSSLIIISSIMLIGIAASAAPNQCDNFILKESHQDQYHTPPVTTMRTFVINFVWLIIVCIVMSVVVFYSRTLFRELNSLNYKHHRISIYALYQPKRSQSFQQRHFIIVKQTSKRLIILFALILIFCVTWFPNFLIIMLKSFIKSDGSFILAAGLFFSIFWLMNPCFNAFVFIYFLIKEHFDENEVDNDNEICGTAILFLMRLLRRLKRPFVRTSNEHNQALVEFYSLKQRLHFENNVGNRLGDINDISEVDGFI